MNRIWIGCAVAAGLFAQGNNLGVSLRFEDETVPPGATVQVKLTLTEPKPIIRSSFESSFESSFFDDIYGVAVRSDNGDASGAVMITPSGIRVAMTSPSQNTGVNPDYPIFTFAAGVKSTVPVGTQIPVDMPSATWLDLLSPYPWEIKPGTITVGGTLSIGNIIPGGGIVPANTPVDVIGTGFTPESQLRVEGADRVTTYVSPTLMQVQFSAATPLDGARFAVQNKDGQRTTYFSYLRPARVNWTQTTALGSVRPMFSGKTLRRASLALFGTGSDTVGIALLNPGTVAAAVTVDYYGISGTRIGGSTVNLAARSETLRSLAELGLGGQATLAVLTSNQPVKALAVRVNGPSLGVISPTIGQ